MRKSIEILIKIYCIKDRRRKKKKKKRKKLRPIYAAVIYVYIPQHYLIIDVILGARRGDVSCVETR